MPTSLDSFDPFAPQAKSLDDFDPFAQPAAPTQATPATPAIARPSGLARRVLGDTAVDLGKGILGVGEAAVGLGNLVSGGYVGKGLEAIGYDPQTSKKMLEEGYTPERVAANKEVADAKGFLPTIAAAIKNPSTIAGAAVESAPLMLGGGAIARGGASLLGKAGSIARPGLMGQLAAIPQTIAGRIGLAAAGEGAVGAGAAAESIRQQTDDGLLGLRETGAALASGAGTAILGALGGKVAQKLGIADVDVALAGGSTARAATAEVKPGLTEAAKRILKRVAGGALTEGVFEELPQSAQEQMWQNYATGKPIMDGVAEAAAMGALAGGVMGGGFSAIAGNPKDATTDKTTSTETPSGVGRPLSGSIDVSNAPSLDDAPTAKPDPADPINFGNVQGGVTSTEDMGAELDAAMATPSTANLSAPATNRVQQAADNLRAEAQVMDAQAQTGIGKAAAMATAMQADAIEQSNPFGYQPPTFGYEAPTFPSAPNDGRTRLAQQAKAQGIDPRIVLTLDDAEAGELDQYDDKLLATYAKGLWSDLQSGRRTLPGYNPQEDAARERSAPEQRDVDSVGLRGNDVPAARDGEASLGSLPVEVDGGTASLAGQAPVPGDAAGAQAQGLTPARAPLSVRMGGNEYPVASYEDASAKFRQLRDTVDVGGMPAVELIDQGGSPVGYIGQGGEVYEGSFQEARLNPERKSPVYRPPAGEALPDPNVIEGEASRVTAGQAPQAASSGQPEAAQVAPASLPQSAPSAVGTVESSQPSPQPVATQNAEQVASVPSPQGTPVEGGGQPNRVTITRGAYRGKTGTLGPVSGSSATVTLNNGTKVSIAPQAIKRDDGQHVVATKKVSPAVAEKQRIETQLAETQKAITAAGGAQNIKPRSQMTSKELKAQEAGKVQSAPATGVDDAAVRAAYNAAMTAKTGQDYDWGKGDFGDMIVGALNRDPEVMERARNILTNGNNETGLKVFFQQAGIKMPKTQREQKAAFDAYIGVSPETRAASDADKAKAQADKREQKVASIRARQPVPDFTDYAEAVRWLNNRSEAFPSKGAYKATPEFAEWYEKAKPLYAPYKEGFTNKRAAALAEAGIKAGDRVQTSQIGMFMTGNTWTGTVTMRGGEPWVRVDGDGIPASKNGKTKQAKLLRWEPRWTKVDSAPPVEAAQQDVMESVEDFRGVSRAEFLGKPRITKDSNASDLRPLAGGSIDSAPVEPFLDGKYTAKFSDIGGAVFDGDKVIASYDKWATLAVDKKFRRQGIGAELVYQFRTRYPDTKPATHRTKKAQALQEKVWDRITRELRSTSTLESIESETLADTDATPAELASLKRQSQYGFRGSDGVGMTDNERSALQVLEREESRANGIEDADKLGLRKAVNSVIGSVFGLPPIQAYYLRGKAGLDGIATPAYLKKLEDQQKGRDGKMRTAGLYLRGEDAVGGKPVFVLFTDVSRVPWMAAFTAAHEVAGHHGLHVLLGKRLRAVLREAVKNQTVRKIADSMYVSRKFGEKVAKGEMTAENARYLAIEEALADLAAALATGNWQRIQDKHGVTPSKEMQSKLRAFIANVVRQIKMLFKTRNVGFSDAQVQQLLANAFKAAQGQSASMTVMGANGALEQVVFHGTPHTVDKFSMQKIGTGEGAQAFGYGLYFASQKEIAESYRKNLSRKIDSLNIDWQNLRPAGKATVAHRLVEMMGKFTYFDADDLASTGLVRQLGDYGPLVDMQPGNEVSLRELMEGMESLRIDTTDGRDVYLFDDGSAIADDGEKYNAVSLKAGNLYRVDVPEDADLMDWDKPLSEQPEKVRAAIKDAYLHYRNDNGESRNAVPQADFITGEGIYTILSAHFAKGKGGLHQLGASQASEYLNSIGIPGLRYLDGTSRTKGEGSANYVIWDESAIGQPQSALESVDNGGMAEDDYRGEHSAPMKDSGAPGHDVTGGGNFYPDDVYGPNGLRYYGTGYDAMDAEAYGHIQRLKNHPNYQITVYRAVPKSVKGGIKAGDWVTTVRRYALDHGRGALNGDYKIQSKIVRANEIFTNGDSWLEWGYDPQPFDEEAQRQLRERRAAKQQQNEPLESTEDQTQSEARVVFDAENGIGSTPDGANIDYMGYEVMMRPSQFLALASPRSEPVAEGLRDAIASGQPVAPAFLLVNFRGDVAKVEQHEGRSRMMSIQDIQGDKPVPVHILPRGGDRARHISPEMREAFRASAISQRGAVVTNNHEAFNPDNPSILESVEADDLNTTLGNAMGSIRDVKLPAGYMLADLFGKQDGKRVSWWSRTIGTQFDLAKREPLFKRVFDSVQNMVADISHYANAAMDLAPDVLPKFDTFRDAIKKQPMSAKDAKVVSSAVFDGTLKWARDRNTGEVIPATELNSGIVWTAEELRSRFGASDKQVGLYQQVRAAIDRSLDDTATTQMIRHAGEDANPVRDQMLAAPTAQAAADILEKHLVDQIKLMQGDARSKGLQETAEQVQQIAKQIDKLKSKGYAPLSRFGRYTVYKDGENPVFLMFETQREANRAARIMKEKGDKGIKQGTMSQEQFKLFKGMTPETLELFGEMLGLDKTGSEQDDLVYQSFLKAAKSNRSALKRLIHRQGIEGYSEDVSRVLASFLYSNARLAATNLHAPETQRAINEIPKEQGDLKDTAIKLNEYIVNPDDAGAFLSSFNFAQYLGGSIASAMVNMTQPLTMSFPWLSQYGGAWNAAKALGEAVKLVGKGGDTGNHLLDEALKRADADGHTQPQEVHQLQALASGKGALRTGDGTKAGDALARAQNAKARLSVLWGVPFSLAEQFNRRSTFIAAWNIAKDQGMADPYGFAVDAVKTTQGIYNKANRPAWSRNAIGGMAFTFKTYSINYVEMLHRMWTQGGKEGKQGVMLAMGVLFLLSGAGGLPGSDDLDDLLDGVMQRFGYNFSSKQQREAFFASLFGETGAKFMEHGLSAVPGMPIDVSGRMGMGNLIPSTGLLVRKDDHTRDVAEIAGPTGDFLKRSFESAGQLAEGNLGASMLAIAPRAVANAWKGVEMAETGEYRDTRGRKVLETTGLEAASKFIGFQPASVAKVQQSSGKAIELLSNYRLVSADIADRWAKGIHDQDPGEVLLAQKDLEDWNAKNPEMPIRINRNALRSRVRNLSMDRRERLAKTTPKAVRSQIETMLGRERVNNEETE